MFAGRVPELRSVIECAFQMESPVLPTIEHYTAEDGYRCAVRVWRQDAPVARAVFLHGIISHGAWYASSSALLAAAGVEVHFIDRRGSGLNAVARGDVDQYLTWLRDVEVYLDRLSADAPRLLLGVSWGGKLAVAVARHRPDLVDGLALLCPGLFARQSANSVQRALLRCAAAAGFHGLRVTIPLRDPGLFTNSLPWQAYVRDDPLTLRKITIRFARADLDLNRYATQASTSQRSWSLPDATRSWTTGGYVVLLTRRSAVPASWSNTITRHIRLNSNRIHNPICRRSVTGPAGFVPSGSDLLDQEQKLLVGGLRVGYPVIGPAHLRHHVSPVVHLDHVDDFPILS